MNEASYALLSAEVRERCKSIQQLYKVIMQRRAGFKDTPEGVDSMAYQIHNLYSAFEELFETVAGFFENQTEGARYHSDPLFRMKVEIEGLRPALISELAYELLDDLRRFRHFFRHAYRAKLDKERVGDIVEVAIQLRELFFTEIERFLNQLKLISK